jgi:hypothetical protein
MSSRCTRPLSRRSCSSWSPRRAASRASSLGALQAARRDGTTKQFGRIRRKHQAWASWGVGCPQRSPATGFASQAWRGVPAPTRPPTRLCASEAMSSLASSRSSASCGRRSTPHRRTSPVRQAAQLRWPSACVARVARPAGRRAKGRRAAATNLPRVLRLDQPPPEGSAQRARGHPLACVWAARTAATRQQPSRGYTLQRRAETAPTQLHR